MFGFSCTNNIQLNSTSLLAYRGQKIFSNKLDLFWTTTVFLNKNPTFTTLLTFRFFRPTATRPTVGTAASSFVGKRSVSVQKNRYRYRLCSRKPQMLTPR